MVHVVCAYQFATLQEIAAKVEEELQQGKARTLVDQMQSFQDWYHVERVMDQKKHDDDQGGAEQEFFKGFQAPSNALLSHTPTFLDDDARTQRKKMSFPEVIKTRTLIPEWEADGQSFSSAY